MTLWKGLALGDAVGKNKANTTNDVLRVKALLNACAGIPMFAENEKADATLFDAITEFQEAAGIKPAKGVVEPGDRTLMALNAEAQFPVVGELRLTRLWTNAVGRIIGNLSVLGTTDTFASIEYRKDFLHAKGPATYELYMDRKQEGNLKCLRFDHPGLHTLLIHVSDEDGNQMKGCIGPGLSYKLDKTPKGQASAPLPVGIRESGKAVDQLLDLLGGFHFGNRCLLHVENNPTGETDDPIEWLNRRRKLAETDNGVW